MKRSTPIVVLKLALALASCSENDPGEPGVTCDFDGCAVECEVPDILPCDYRTESCAQALAELVACARGSSLDMLPEIQVIDETEAEALYFGTDETVDSMDMMTSPMSSSDAAAAREDYLARVHGLYDGAFQLMELLDPDNMTAETVRNHTITNLAAWYSAKEKTIFIIDRGEPIKSPGNTQTLAHELVHALQDQELDLLEWSAGGDGSLDSRLALASYVEGEARLFEWVTIALVERVPLESLQLQLFMDLDMKATQLGVLEADSPVAPAVGDLRYAAGGSEWARRWLSGQKALDTLRKAPFQHSVEWLLGKPIEAVELQNIEPPNDFELVAIDQLGAYVLYAILVESGYWKYDAPLAPAWDAAGAWRGDRLELFVEKPEEVTPAQFGPTNLSGSASVRTAPPPETWGRAVATWSFVLETAEAKHALEARAEELPKVDLVDCAEAQVLVIAEDRDLRRSWAEDLAAACR